MAVGYVIVAHHRPAQLLRLVRTIRRGSDGPIVIHIDRRTRADFSGVEQALLGQGDVAIISAVAVRWAHVSQVEAELAALATMLDRAPAVEHVQHLTGQCYPIKPLADFERAVAAHPGQSMLDCVELPQSGFEALWHHVSHYHLLGPGRRVLALPWLRRLPLRRFVAGSPYWCLARAHARALIDLPVRARAFYRGVLSSDEVFFQTELANSVHADAVVPVDWTWAEWEGDKASPSILTRRHVGILAQRPEFFARKFDATVDADVLDWLDHEVLV